MGDLERRESRHKLSRELSRRLVVGGEAKLEQIPILLANGLWPTIEPHGARDVIQFSASRLFAKAARQMSAEPKYSTR